VFERLSNGWQLAKQSLTVLMLDKELLIFPFLSGISCIAVLASFALPLWNTQYGAAIFEEGAIPEDPLTYLILFAFYFANYFVIVFFNSALVACAIIRFRGGDPTVADGLSAAFARLPQILAWTAVTASVGFVLRIIESRSEKVGQIITGLLGMGWSAVTYFVVPVLVVEKTGPVDAVKRSLSILRKTWGESLGANFGIGFICFLPNLLGIAMLFGGVVSLGANPVLGSAQIACGIAVVLITSLVSSALSTILLGALYIYASEGRPPQYYDDNLFQNAFAHR
jgi:hypothetical protein